METTNGSWENWVEDFAALDEAEFDEDFAIDDAFAEEDEEDETDAERVRRKYPRRKRVTRAQPRQQLSQRVQGRRIQGMIQTPNGPARFAVPGKILTIEEFRKTVDALQQDIKKNATGIQQLGEQQRQDIARLTAMMAQTEKKLAKRLRNTQMATIIIATIPLIARVLEKNGILKA